MISYKPLLNYMLDNNIPIGYLNRELSINPTVTAKFRKGEYVHLEIIERICNHFKIPIEQVIEIVIVDDSKE